VDSTLAVRLQHHKGLRLGHRYTIFDLYCSCCAKNSLEPASKLKNKQKQVDKQTTHRPCPRDESPGASNMYLYMGDSQEAWEGPDPNIESTTSGLNLIQGC
jgi:hypothetical protein